MPFVCVLQCSVSCSVAVLKYRLGESESSASCDPFHLSQSNTHTEVHPLQRDESVFEHLFFVLSFFRSSRHVTVHNDSPISD